MEQTRKSPMYTLMAMAYMMNRKKAEPIVNTATTAITSFLSRSVTAAATSTANLTLLQRYVQGCNESPFLYKGMTSGILKALSKITAVAVEGKQADARQIIGTFIYGFTIDTWCCHFWYSYGLPYFENILINATVGQNAPGLIKAALATAFSSIVFDLPYIWIYGTTSGLLSGLYSSWDEAAAASNKGTYGAWKDGLKVWPGFTFLSMYFLPRDLVVPAGNMIGYFWNTYFMLMQSRGSK